jgi:uncharacterized membrane protein
MSSRSRSFRPAAALAGLLGVSGVGHFARPGFFDAIVPRSLPGEPRSWTYASGVAELGNAAALAVPRTRKLGGHAAAALFIAVLPANVSMALRWSDRSARERTIAYGRLPLQVPLVVWALRIARPPRARR